MADYGNYMVEANPFGLAGPPDYWLKALYEFDCSLVVMPSKMGFWYRLCQRRRPTLATKIVNEILKEDLDTRMIAARNLVPVTTLLATTNWGNYPAHLEELRRRSPHRMGGAAKVIQDVEAAERQVEIDKANQTDVALTDVSKDAWGLYLKKIGLRSHMWIPSTPGSRPAPTGTFVRKSQPKPEVMTIWAP